MLHARNTLVGTIILTVVAAAGASPTAHAADAPDWLRQAAQAPTPALDRNVPALILRNEQRVTIEDDGRVLTATSYAVRVLTRAGRSAAAAREVYRTDTGKVRDLKAWLIPTSGGVWEYGKDDTADVALVNEDVYNEARMRRIAAGEEAQPGSVFGFEATSEDRAIFTQFEFQFQNGLPTTVARLSVTVPNGWRVESVTFNHDEIRPTVNGSSYAWELRNLPKIDEEPASPEISALVPRVAVSVFPPAGPRAAGIRTFSSWKDVSLWITELNDSQAIVNDAVASKAKALTATANSDFERISAIGKFVQGIQYVSIQTGVGRGGGYRPHSSVEVLSKAYGDCKDKVNLMRTMLKAVGIDAHPVAIYSGDPAYVREEWPSPQQFNHAVIAIAFTEDRATPSLLKHPVLGSLLIFDPTDPETPVGQLPEHEQGSWALLAAGERGGIARMPITDPEANRLERTVEAALDANGALTAIVFERSVGHAASLARSEFRTRSRADYTRLIEAWVASSVSAAKVANVTPADNESSGDFTLRTDFAAPRYGQLMQNRLLIFKPTIVSRRASLYLTEPQRKHPITLSAQAYTETVRVKLPEGFEVDEVPDPVNLETSFGMYSANHRVENGYLVFRRTLTIRRSTVPASEYRAVRSFYERILAVEQSPAVLIRK